MIALLRTNSVFCFASDSLDVFGRFYSFYRHLIVGISYPVSEHVRNPVYFSGARG